MKRVIHRLVGYDAQTDRMKVQFDIPDDLMPQVGRIAKVSPDDPAAVWSYPLTEAGTQCVADLIGVGVAPGAAEFFLEAFAAD